MSRQTPSRVLREAILEYSRERRRSRQRGGQRNCKIPEVLTTTSQEPLENVLSDIAQPEIDINKSADESTVVDERHDQEQSKSTIGEISSSFFRDSAAKCFTAEHDKDSSMVEAGPTQLDNEDETLYSELEEPRKTTHCPWSSSPKFYVQNELKDGDMWVQTRFIQKIMVFLFLKACVVLGWLKTVELLDVVAQHYKAQYQFHYVAGGFYGVAKLAIRIENGGACRRRHRCVFLIYFFLELMVASDFVGCLVAHLLDSQFNIPRRVLCCIAGTYVFFIIVGAFVMYDMQDGIMVGTAFIVTAILTIHQFVHFKATEGLEILRLHTSAGMDELFCALTVVITSEMIIIIIMTELQSILGGQRYALYPNDWLYTSIYLI